jgi:hypothetical protein
VNARVDSRLKASRRHAFNHSVPTLTLVFVGLSVKLHAQRWMLVTSNLILLALWFVFAYSPQHWFGRSWMGRASIGDNKVPAVVYIANPGRVRQNRLLWFECRMSVTTSLTWAMRSFGRHQNQSCFPSTTAYGHGGQRAMAVFTSPCHMSKLISAAFAWRMAGCSQSIFNHLVAKSRC